MGQLGHADPKVTLGIYAHVLKQQERISAGRNFDALTTGLGTSAQTARIDAASMPIVASSDSA